MKKISIFIIFFFIASFASNINSKKLQQKIISKISIAIKQNKKMVKVCIKGNKTALSNSKHLKVVKECKDADLAIVEEKIDYIKRYNLPIITLDYNLLKVYPQAVGAFFWQKGRPNIVFIEPRLKKFHISLPKEFKSYIETKIW